VADFVTPDGGNASRLSHYDAELDRPEHLRDERLVEIVAECLNRWDAFPTIPGSKRWSTNGRTALVELEYRLAMERQRV
jgi:hypothetical protein